MNHSQSSNDWFEVHIIEYQILDDQVTQITFISNFFLSKFVRKCLSKQN